MAGSISGEHESNYLAYQALVPPRACFKYAQNTQARPKSHGGTGSQRLGKKTILHSDIAHYEMYMQLQQMRRLG